ncbi:MAG TPA: hypothetical protein VLF59_02795 [Candidatus Saccharimonadales bacterium]|nr:hypothetical protein [Candidatus Saccharimonadales bacterium]
MKRFLVFLSLTVLVVSSLTQSGVFTKIASADPAYSPSALISDALFTANTSMSASDIQTFLNSHNSGLKSTTDIEDCGSTSDPHYAYFTTVYSCGSRVSAAQIIYDSAQAYGISPKVILGTLQKEQSLVTTPNPTTSQLNCAMGYRSCSGVVGFFNQVDYATWQFKAYIMLMTGQSFWGKSPSQYPCAAGSSLYSTGLYPGKTVTFNNPGGTAQTITLANAATAGLYCYTPYVGPYVQTGYSGSYNFVINYEQWFGPSTSNADSYVLNFVDIANNSGNVQILGYPSIGSYGYYTRINYSGYPKITPDGAVIPLFNPHGDLSFVRLNHGSGQVEVVTYSAASGFSRMSGYNLAGYPAILADGNVIPRYLPNGDLAFIRMNHSSGLVEVVTYSLSSGFTRLNGYYLSGYPAIGVDASVTPLFTPSGDLAFVRLNHSSGQAEVVTYSASSGYRYMSNYSLSGYPAVTGDGSVVTQFEPNGDLAFIRLNHSSGDAQVVSYNAGSGYKILSGVYVTSYPAVSAPYKSVVPLFTP